MKKYFSYNFSGDYDNREFDYDEYGVAYLHGDEGEFAGNASVIAESEEEAERIIREKINDEVCGDFSVVFDGGETDISEYGEEALDHFEGFEMEMIS